MRIRSSLITAHYEARLGRHARLLIWFSARNRSTAETETLGLWNGDDNATFSIGGEPRDYYGAGAIIGIEPLVYRTGLRVGTQRLTLSPIDPAVQAVIREYEPRLAPVEMHIADFDPVSGNLIDEPERIYSGKVDKVRLTTPELGGEAQCVVEMLGAAEALHRTLALKKSDESLQARAAGDRFRRYTDLTGVVDCYWGEARAAAPAPTAAQDAPEAEPRPETEGGR